jgi:DNA-binding SARP family transcriptional activator
MPHRLTLHLFGGIEAKSGLSGSLHFPTRKAAALTAYLALEPARRHTRDAIAEMLWGQVPPAQARHSLRQTLTEIRTTFGDSHEDYLICGDDTIAIRTKGLRVDALVLQHCLRRNTMRSLRTACALYDGEFLAGITLHESSFDLWIASQRIRLRQLAVEAHELYAERLTSDGRLSRALETALRLVSLDPLNEGAHRTTISLYARSGQLAAALRQYEALSRILGDELGIAPERETQDLLRNLLTSRDRARFGRRSGPRPT